MPVGHSPQIDREEVERIASWCRAWKDAASISPAICDASHDHVALSRKAVLDAHMQVGARFHQTECAFFEGGGTSNLANHRAVPVEIRGYQVVHDSEISLING